MLLITIWYFFHNYFFRPWPQPPEIGLDIGLGLVALASDLASASASRFWPRLTSLVLVVVMGVLVVVEEIVDIVFDVHH